MAQITALQNTLLKKQPVQGSSLADDQKVMVNAGREYSVDTININELGHTQLTFSYGLGTWFVYDKHWAGLKHDQATALDVKYYSQRDNYRDANRTCFSSTCAMWVNFYRPGVLLGDQGDDDYIKTVFEYGDTTSAQTQLYALNAYGIKAEFRQDGSLDDLRALIDAGHPVPVGILHKGTKDAPSGGGHWLLVTGYDNAGFICNDPWGELNHATGQYREIDGEGVHYSNELMSKRWTVSKFNDGWYLKR